jgi:hypothetical protein
MERKSVVSALRGETDKHILRILDIHAGDREYQWDPNESGGGTAVLEAEEAFGQAVSSGMQGYKSVGSVATLTSRFDPAAETTVVAPRIAGG